MCSSVTVVLRGMVAVVLLLQACGNGGAEPFDAAGEADGQVVDADALRGRAPVIESVTFTENPSCVLSAILDVETDVEASISLRIDGGGRSRTVRFKQRGMELSLPVLGLREKTVYKFTVFATGDGGAESSHDPVAYQTAAIPDGPFPPLEVVSCQQDSMQPGITVISSMILQLPLDQRPGLILAVDSEGEVIWYHTHPNQVLEFFALTRAGTLLYLAGTDGAREMDMLGRTLREWKPDAEPLASGIEVLGVHHDIIELPDDHVAAIGIEMRDIEHVVDGKMVTHHVMGDVILE